VEQDHQTAHAARRSREPSHEVRAPTKSYMPVRLRLIGFSARLVSAPVSMRAERPSVRSDRPPGCSTLASSFHVARPLQSSFAVLPPPRAFARAAFLPGFRPSSRHHQGASTCWRSAPDLAPRSALGLSQPLSGLLPLSARGLVSSRCHVKGSRRHPGPSLPSQPPSLSRGAYPPAVDPEQLTSFRRVHRSKPRPRGLSPRRAALLRFGGYPREARFPLWLLLLQVLVSPRRVRFPGHLRSRR